MSVVHQQDAVRKAAVWLTCPTCGSKSAVECRSRGDRSFLNGYLHVSRLREAEAVVAVTRYYLERELKEKGWSAPESY